MKLAVNSKDNEEEKELITRINAGERDEYRILVEAHQHLVFSVVRKQISQPEIAQEIAQETFVKGYLNLRSFKFQSRFSTWITRIALNETSNFFNSKRFKEGTMTHSFELQQHDHPAEPNLPDPKLSAFQYALGKLEKNYRDVIVMCSLEGNSYEDAATILSIPVGTVRSRLNRARLLLKDLIISNPDFTKRSI